MHYFFIYLYIYIFIYLFIYLFTFLQFKHAQKIIHKHFDNYFVRNSTSHYTVAYLAIVLQRLPF